MLDSTSTLGCRDELFPESLAFLCRFFHFLSQTQRPHVSPDFLDIGQTLRFHAAFAGILPPERVLSIGRPYRVLLLVIHDHLVNCIVLSFFHFFPPLMSSASKRSVG